MTNKQDIGITYSPLVTKSLPEKRGAIHIGKYVVFWQSIGGTNTHHFFDTFEEAEKYCLASKTDPSIAYVVYETAIRAEITKMDDMVKRIKQIEGKS